MNIKNFEENLKTRMEENSNKLIKEFSKGNKLITLIEKRLMKDLSRILHIEFDTLSLMSFIEKINKNPKLKKKLKNEIGDVDEFYTSLQTCEMCIYNMYCQIEWLNMYNKKK